MSKPREWYILQYNGDCFIYDFKDEFPPDGDESLLIHVREIIPSDEFGDELLDCSDMKDERAEALEVIVTLPLPPQQLKPNVRCHYMAKANHVARYRLAAKEAGMIAAYDYDLRKPIKKPIVTVAAYWPTTRRMDADNLLATMKAAFDGLTDAGIWTDDRECTFLPCHQQKDANNPRIDIQVKKTFE